MFVFTEPTHSGLAAERDLPLRRLSYRREIYEAFGFSSAASTPTGEPSFFDGMSLNIRLRADENCAAFDEDACMVSSNAVPSSSWCAKASSKSVSA
jgi:hypothetical protein